MLARASALARLPGDMDPVESAPLLCAGITTFNALRHCGARPGDLVAIHGVGGLGHLAIQFAARQGFRTVAVNRGGDKEPLARSLGAQDYIDSERSDPAAALQALGGATAIIATVTSAEAMQAIVGGLGVNGTLMVIGAVGALTVNSLELLGKRAAVKGWYSGTAVDSEDTLRFSQRNQGCSVDEGIDAWLEIAALARAAGIRTQITISTAFGCPFEGEVQVARVRAIAERVAAGNPDEIAVADTIGVAVPTQVGEVIAGSADAAVV